MTERRTLTVVEVAEALGVGRQTVYDAIARGDIRCIRIGRRIVIPRDVLTELGIAPVAASRSEAQEAEGSVCPMPRPRHAQTSGVAS